jgi:hypothetical protein
MAASMELICKINMIIVMNKSHRPQITTTNRYFGAWSYARDPNSAKEADLGQV